MTPVFRLCVALPVIGLLAWLSACASDSAPALPVTQAGFAPTQLRASDAAPGDVFGCAVALSRDGSTMAVGADLKALGQPDNGVPAAGAVYVYTRTPQGWREQARLRATVPSTGSGFGHSLSLSDDGNRLAIGAPFESHSAAGRDAGAEGEQGSVYVFARRDGAWDLQSRLLASKARGFDWFGMSVSLAGRGHTLAVGAQRHDGGDARAPLADSGAVHVFTLAARGWTEQTVVQADHPQAGGRLGASVSLSSDGLTLAAGAGATGRGAVHVFHREAEGWREQALVTSADATEQHPLGSQVLLSADGATLAVGAATRGDTGARQVMAGSAYVFENQGGQWLQRARLQAPNAQVGDGFGERLALSADGRVLAVSAVQETTTAAGLNGEPGDNRALWSGVVHVYTLDGARWSRKDGVTSARTRRQDLSGSALALSGDGRQLAVGARLDDGPGAWSLQDFSFGGPLQNSGAVYLYPTI